MMFRFSLRYFKVTNTFYLYSLSKSTLASSKYAFLNKSLEKVEKDKLCLVDHIGKFTYRDILKLSKHLSLQLEKSFDNSTKSNAQEKIGIYCSNNYTYLISILAVWMLNGVPFCLNKKFPPKFVEYYLNDSACKLVINSRQETTESSGHDDEFDRMLEKKNIYNFRLDESFYRTALKTSSESIGFVQFVTSLIANENNREALLLYTSGTSGPSKGVVITFENLLSSIENMVECYKWTSNDFNLNPLPLNHYSGLVYCMLTPFFVGASCEVLPKFNADLVWRKLLANDRRHSLDSMINVFIAVPTIYSQLVDEYAKSENLQREIPVDQVKNVLHSKMRIIASGSAPLSVKTFQDWHKLTNFRILERYGMTEIGMAVSTSYEDSSKRIGGTIGRPCGNNLCRVYDNSLDLPLLESTAKSDTFLNGADKNEVIFGELQVKGPNVFQQYHNKPDETRDSFTQDGWFKTGDTVEYLKDLKVFKIVGRTSVDVIKSGGHKMSALDIERELLTNEMIEDVAVIGLRDVKWGQIVLALVVLKPKHNKLDTNEFVKWCKMRLPKYSVPRLVEVVDTIPKNQLGKVNKKDLIKFYEAKFKLN